MRLNFSKDLKKRNYYKKFEVKRLVVSAILNASFLDRKIRQVFFNKSFRNYPKYSAFGSFKNRCFLTNMSRNVRISGTFFPLSRHNTRNAVLKSELFPWRPGSW